MKILFIFLDGIGLGPDDPLVNPFARAEMPFTRDLLDGKALTMDAVPINNMHASLLALDSCLGVDGLPQSATGQASLMTGRNIPAEIGYHYGPKPDKAVAAKLKQNNLFHRLLSGGKQVTFLNAYPPGYFDGIRSGYRLMAAIPLAVSSSGIELKSIEDLQNGRAISADFTGLGWQEHLGIKDIPVISVEQAGARMAKLAQEVDFALFEYWLSDYAGHNQNMDSATNQLYAFDHVLAALVETWNKNMGLIVITSDHGNMEDLSTRKHTKNPVPGLIIGEFKLRERFTSGMTDITHFTPAILKFLSASSQLNKTK